MFFLYADIVVGAAIGGARVIRDAKEVLENVTDIDTINKSPKSADFYIVQGHCGYEKHWRQFFAKIYALGEYGFFTPSKYINHPIHLGAGINLGFCVSIFSVFAGGGVVQSWIKNTQYDTIENGSKPWYNLTSKFEGVIQPFIVAGFGIQLFKNLTVTTQYQCKWSTDWTKHEQEYSNDGLIMNIPGTGVSKHADKITTPTKISNKPFAHSVLLGVHYNFKEIL